MNGKIIGEDECDIGVFVTDNLDKSHQIEMNKHDGVIYAHDQDSYPDHPDNRTKAGNEHVNQARRFAKYWVYHQRGYDTLDGWQNPDRITLAATALMALDEPIAESISTISTNSCRASTAISIRQSRFQTASTRRVRCICMICILEWTTRIFRRTQTL